MKPDLAAVSDPPFYQALPTHPASPQDMATAMRTLVTFVTAVPAALKAAHKGVQSLSAVMILLQAKLSAQQSASKMIWPIGGLPLVPVATFFQVQVSHPQKSAHPPPRGGTTHSQPCASWPKWSSGTGETEPPTSWTSMLRLRPSRGDSKDGRWAIWLEKDWWLQKLELFQLLLEVHLLVIEGLELEVQQAVQMLRSFSKIARAEGVAGMTTIES